MYSLQEAILEVCCVNVVCAPIFALTFVIIITHAGVGHEEGGGQRVG